MTTDHNILSFETIPEFIAWIAAEEVPEVTFL